MTIVPLDGVLLKRLILRRFPQGVTAFQDAWSAVRDDDRGGDAAVPDRTGPPIQKRASAADAG